MKNKVKILLAAVVVGIVIIGIIGMSWLFLVLSFFIPANAEKSLISPNGQKVLNTSLSVDPNNQTKNGNIKFTIQQTSNKTILGEIVTNASNNMKWSVKWLNDKKIQLDSSDTGTYCWEEQENAKWAVAGC